MKKERFFELMKYTDDELIKEAEKAEPGTRRKRSPWLKWVVSAACLCLVVCAVIALILRNSDPRGTSDTVLPADINDIIWADSLDDANAWVVPKWHGWNVDYWLHGALEKADDDDFLAVIVKRSFDERARKNYIFEGMTYDQMVAEADEKRRLCTRLEGLSKEGSVLKYGEALYTTGTPNGVKWAKSLYDQRVEYYGELLSVYISDGEFDGERVMTDMLALENEVKELYRKMEECIKSYQNTLTDEDRQRFKSDGMNTHYKDGTFYLFVKKQQLIDSGIGDRGYYRLILGRREQYEGKIILTPADIDIPQ